MKEMVWEKTWEKQNQCKNGDVKGKVVGEGYNFPSEGSLRNCNDNALMLLTQEIEGFSTPVIIHGGPIVAKEVEGKGKEKEMTKEQQPPKEKPSIRLFTTNFKPRLKWTPELHARFVDALNELGGPDKVTPKRLLDAIGIEGLEIHHIKSHLQNYRRRKTTVREWPQVPEICNTVSQLSAGTSIGTSTSYQTIQASGYKKFKGKGQGQSHGIKKIDEMHKDGQGLIYQKLKAETYRKIPNSLIRETSEKLVDQLNGGADANTDADAIRMHVLLQNAVHIAQAHGLQSQNTAYSTTNDFPKSNVNYSENMAYLLDFQPQSASSNFKPQNASCDYQPQSASFNFQAQNASYDYYQPQSAAIGNQLQDAVFECLPHAAAYGYQPQNAAYSAPSNLPISKGQFSETAYLDDLNAAFAVIGNTSLEAFNLDTVKDHMIWDDPQPNSQDNALAFSQMREQSGHVESLATQKELAPSRMWSFAP